MIAGSLAGGVTGILHTRFKINGLLSGILVATALYSVNLHVMKRSNIPLLDARTVSSDLVSAAERVWGQRRQRPRSWSRRSVSRRRQLGCGPGLSRTRRLDHGPVLPDAAWERRCAPPATTRG